MARKNTMAVTCPQCNSIDVRMSKWKNRFEQVLDLLGMPPMRCFNCDHRWRHSLWRIREMFYARCPRCYRLELVRWEETYYHVPSFWKFLIAIGAKKVRCKACRHNFVSFRLVRGNTKKWDNSDPSEPLAVESSIELSSLEKAPEESANKP
jgi:ssDNA-binding Zn-finger/Zn-ribbon topoisomerase 1